MVSLGQKLPNVKVLLVTEEGQETIHASNYFAGKTVAIFAMPGAFTATCSNSHLPNVISHKGELNAKGVDEVAIMVVNDSFVVREWAKVSGAFSAGLTMIADAGSDFTTAMGMNFTARVTGLHERSQRYALLSRDGTVSKLLIEEARGQVLSSGANHLLKQI